MARTMLTCLAALLACAVIVELSAWVSSMTNGGTRETRNAVPPDGLIRQLVDEAPRARFYVAFAPGACGTPFQQTLNYLYNRKPSGVAVLTGKQSLPLVHALPRQAEITVSAIEEELLSEAMKYGTPVVVERVAQGQLLVPHVFERRSSSELVRSLDRLFGVGPAAE